MIAVVVLLVSALLLGWLLAEQGAVRIDEPSVYRWGELRLCRAVVVTRNWRGELVRRGAGLTQRADGSGCWKWIANGTPVEGRELKVLEQAFSSPAAARCKEACGHEVRP